MEEAYASVVTQSMGHAGEGGSIVSDGSLGSLSYSKHGGSLSSLIVSKGHVDVKGGQLNGWTSQLRVLAEDSPANFLMASCGGHASQHARVSF